MSNWTVDTDKVRQLLEGVTSIRCYYNKPLLLTKPFNGEKILNPVAPELSNEIGTTLSVNENILLILRRKGVLAAEQEEAIRALGQTSQQE